MSEVECDDKLNGGFIKKMSGGDKITSRYLHNNEIVSFKANFSLLLICNDIPEVDKMDNAFASRLRCIQFLTEFVNEPIEPHQKKINKNISQKIQCWKNDFMLLLIEYYFKYIEEGLIPTKSISEWTNVYKEEVDSYLEYIKERLEESDKHTPVSIIYTDYKNWCIENSQKYSTRKIFSRDMKKYLKMDPSKIDGKSCRCIKNMIIKDN